MSSLVNDMMMLENMTNQKYCLYIKRGVAISEIMECSSKNNIGLKDPELVIMRSSEYGRLQEMYHKLQKPLNQLTMPVLQKMRQLRNENELADLKQMILDYTGKSICCVASIDQFLESHGV